MATVRFQHTIFIAIALCAVSSLAAAQFQSRTAPATLNTNAATDTDTDYMGSVEGDGAGNWVAVWQLSYVNDTADLMVARSSDNGATWSTPALLVANGDSDGFADNSPELATDGAGTWIVVWNRGTGSYDCYQSRSTDNGATWSTPAPLDTSADNDGGFGKSDITADGAGNWVAVWQGQTGSDFNIHVAHSVDNGVTWSVPTTLNQHDPNDGLYEQDPRVATDGAGNWLAVWGGHFEYEPGNFETDILVSRSTNNGATWSTPGAVNPNAADDTVEDNDPEIASDGLGNWVAVWNASDAGFGPDRDVFAATSTDNGLTWTAPVPVNADAATDNNFDYGPDIVTDGAGNWMASWGPFGLSGHRVIARSSDNGGTWGPETTINVNATASTAGRGEPRATTDGAGTWLVYWAWENVADDSDEDVEIYYTRWNNILAPDRDGDNLSDADESTAGTNIDDWDSDNDNLSDEEEVNTYNTNPLAEDTDGDGIWDFIELDVGTDPNDALDFPVLPVRFGWVILASVALVAAGWARMRKLQPRS